MKTASLLILILILITGSAWGQGEPPKHQQGSKENPYHTTSEDSVSLRQHFELRCKSLEDKVFQKFESLKEALESARASMERRLDGMNEFRDSLKDQATRFVSKDEYQSQIKAIETDIRSLMTAKDLAEGKASQSQLFVVLGLSVVGLLFSILSFAMKFRKEHKDKE